ncbi:unnamed protein product [Vitrella brassicaformis CCMP3155]|uniref:Uncharacterized protein n=1 Tax=Vitrella brassicaformis (strain CCMP3155) TaxID=1169540 RepID=A0A0G4EGP7_VITBC|nr:unnamed protein product [Vitrella brassicaformis CCMP3155]|eukprot:CEL94670.1 unnamed protein product [Vitrella brassicaformis CCMP3155]
MIHRVVAGFRRPIDADSKAERDRLYGLCKDHHSPTDVPTDSCDDAKVQEDGPRTRAAQHLSSIHDAIACPGGQGSTDKNSVNMALRQLKSDLEDNCRLRQSGR